MKRGYKAEEAIEETLTFSYKDVSGIGLFMKEVMTQQVNPRWIIAHCVGGESLNMSSTLWKLIRPYRLAFSLATFSPSASFQSQTVLSFVRLSFVSHYRHRAIPQWEDKRTELGGLDNHDNVKALLSEECGPNP